MAKGTKTEEPPLLRDEDLASQAGFNLSLRYQTKVKDEGKNTVNVEVEIPLHGRDQINVTTRTENQQGTSQRTYLVSSKNKLFEQGAKESLLQSKMHSKAISFQGPPLLEKTPVVETKEATLNEQTEVIDSWWKAIVKKFERDQRVPLSKKPVLTVPVEEVCLFLVQQGLVRGQGEARDLVKT